MIERTTLSIVVIAILFAGSIAYPQAIQYPYPDTQQSAPRATPSVIVNSSSTPSPASAAIAPQAVVNLIQSMESLSNWRKSAESIVTDKKDPNYNNGNLAQESNYFSRYIS